MAPTILLRFQEPAFAALEYIRPRDEAGSLEDLVADPGMVKTRGPIGGSQGAVFLEAIVLSAVDRVPGTTAHTRDVTVQAFVAWDSGNQSGTIGCLIARGRGVAAAEGCAYNLRLDVPAPNIGRVRLGWVSGGADVQDSGALFDVTADPGGYTLLTATRKWVSTTEVLCRYYLGDTLIGESLSADGDITASASEATYIGSADAAFTDSMFGALDELLVADHEMSHEEIAATWQRVTKLQEDGVDVVRGLFPPGMPITGDLASNVQGDIRAIGVGLGNVIATVDNVRQNLLPDRAYGPALLRWETITRQPTKANDSTATRRARILSHLRQRAGVSIAGEAEALRAVLQLTPDQMEMLAFANIITDDFTTMEDERWIDDGVAPAWSLLAGELRGQANIGADIREGIITGATYRNGKYRRTSVDNADGIRVAVKVTPTSLPIGASAGIRLFNAAKNAWFFLGIAYDGVNHYVISDHGRDGVASTVTVHATAAGVAVTTWLIIGQTPGGTFLLADEAAYDVSWSTTSATSGFTTADAGDGLRDLNFVDLHFRSDIAAIAAGLDVRFDDVRILSPNGYRPFYHYVFRDPALPGDPDVKAGHAILQRMKHAHTIGTVITSRSLLCDDDASGCDRGPMGAL